MKYGYARVSTDGQSLDAQVKQLRAAGAEKVFRETASGARADRAQLARALAQLDKGDVLTVTRLDRLARSTRDLLNTLATITAKGAGFRSLHDTWADTTTAHGRSKVVATATRLQVIEKKTIDIVETARIIVAPDDCELFCGDLPIMSAPPTQRQRCQRAKIKTRHAGQAMLPFDMAPTVIELASRLGPTHQAIAEKLGISRAQVSNIINGQFGPSRSVARRVLELSRAA